MIPHRIRTGPHGCAVMEYDFVILYQQSVALKFELKPYGFWNKLGYFLGFVTPGDVLAVVESGIQNNIGKVCYLDMHRYSERGKAVYKGFGHVVPGLATIRIIVDDSVRSGRWCWSFDFSTLNN